MTWKTLSRLMLTSAVLVSLSGCYTIRYDVASLPEDSVQMTPAANAQEGRHFVSEQKAAFIVAGLAPIMQPNVAEMVSTESRGKKVQNVRIKSEATFTDGLITVGAGVLWAIIGGSVGLATGNATAGTMTTSLLGLLTPTIYTVTVEGDTVVPAAK